MSLKTTFDIISSFIIFESFICINRSYLIENPKLKSICNSITLTVTTIILGIIVYDIVYIESVRIGIIVFLIYISLLFLILASLAFWKKCLFEMLRKLDEKCTGVDDDYFTSMKKKTTSATVIAVSSAVVDFAAASSLRLGCSAPVIICVATLAQDAELTLIGLLISGINMRLSKLEEMSPRSASRIYRGALLASEQLNGEFQFRISLMIVNTVVLNMAYAVVCIFLAESELFFKVVVYIAWRELRSLYAIWYVCSASATSDGICRSLASHLACRLVFDKSQGAGQYSEEMRLVRRWYFVVAARRPRYNTSSHHPLDLAVPLKLLNASATYFIIIIQVYMAYQ